MLKLFQNKWVFGIGAPVIAGLILYFFGIGKSDTILKVSESPNSINTIGQTGNNTINVSNNVPPKIIRKNANAINIPQNNLYNQTFRLYISNPSNKLFDISIKTPPKVFSTQVMPEGLAQMGNGQTVAVYFISFNTYSKITEDEIEFTVASKE